MHQKILGKNRNARKKYPQDAQVKERIRSILPRERKRRNFEKKYFNKSSTNWVRHDGDTLGSRMLNEISDNKGNKGWLKVSADNLLEKFIVCEFPIDSTQEEKRKWLSFVEQTFKKLAKDVNYSNINDPVIQHANIKMKWGEKSGRKTDFKEMVSWVKSRHEELKTKFKSAGNRYEQIALELKQKKFGRIEGQPYTIERIKTLIYSKKLG